MMSVLRQTYPDIEYLVVDGASSDETVSVARHVAGQFPERSVRVVSEPDRGISDAMNKGIAWTTGQLVCHLHAGDQFADSRVIERVVDSQRSTNWRWAVAKAVTVNEKGLASHIYRPASDHRRLLVKNSIPHQSTFLSREIFERYGGFRADLKQAMDYEFWVRIGVLGGERYSVLPFIATRCLEGGRSSRIGELLVSLASLRSEFRKRGIGNTRAEDLVFLSRVATFWAISRVVPRKRRPLPAVA
jgi:glycosyltransferase